MMKTGMNRRINEVPQGIRGLKLKSRKRTRGEEDTNQRSLCIINTEDQIRSGVHLHALKKKDKVEASANVRKRSLFSKRAKEVVGRRAKSITPKTNQKKKKVRIYKRYIQKKFSPSIMRDVIGNLSKSQVEWVKSTGFGELLHFRMEHYAHNLGYNIAESFDGKSCSVKLKAGVIKIDDRVVHSVMGLPIGDEIIICNEDSAVCDIWAEQFSGFVSSQISPLMVRDKILENRQADTNFKIYF
ncbi:uncharacterized protein LOC141685986 [Apium graveolens]|uniref:uncharacterized protein LOC141685986 n=1 Tax=Apium graveolens TaxID=4045 RepID=UPI003D7BF052